MMIIFGINPANVPFDIPDFDQVAHKINVIGTMLFDRNSDLKEYGNIQESLLNGEMVIVEVGGRKVRIEGMVDFAGVSLLPLVLF